MRRIPNPEKRIALKLSEYVTVLITDNAAFHKSEAIWRIIESNGHQLLFLPASPDLNLIKSDWGLIKSSVKK